MEALIACSVGVLAACGAYLAMQSRTFSLVLGLSLLSYAVNLFLFASGRLDAARPPIIEDGATGYADPVPQALVLTAIVIGFGMSAFIVVLSLAARSTTGSDHVDAGEPSDRA